MENRNPRNMQDLLKLAIENTPSSNENADQEENHSPGPMSEERMSWLRQALSDMTRDEVKDMHDCLKVLHTLKNSDDEDSISQKENALETLQEMCESIDNAKDFHTIGGMTVIQDLLNDSSSSVRWRTGDLLATLAQNNPYCQKVILDMGFLPSLLELIDKDNSDNVQVKALYALSCLTRNFEEAQNKFSECNGFSVLLRAMQTPTYKLKVKAAFLLTSLVLDRPDYKDTLCKMGMVEQLAYLLRAPHDQAHEHVMSALLALVSDFEDGLAACRQPQLQLQQLLKDRLEAIAGQDQYQEEQENAHQLLSLCFSAHDRTDVTPEEER